MHDNSKEAQIDESLPYHPIQKYQFIKLLLN